MASLDADTIARLLATETTTRHRVKRLKEDIRDTDVWFSLEHDITSECAVPNHEDNVSNFQFLTNAAYERALNRKRVVATVNGTVMCRYCFLSGVDKREAVR